MLSYYIKPKRIASSSEGAILFNRGEYFYGLDFLEKTCVPKRIKKRPKTELIESE
jgi:hypothetical protein|tara:strand:+ start:473 stop:637 length:165 start_codon:yes stop_codon:yes gene_type:complete